MRTSTILLTVAAVFLTAVAAAIGFLAGRAGVPDPEPPIADGPRAALATFPKYELSAADQSAASNPRADLIRALGQVAPEGDRAVRLAMNAWLAAEGAAAIMAARNDPELGDAAERMMQLALYAYPEIVVEDPALLEGVPEHVIATAVSAIAMFSPDAARAIIDSHLAGSAYGDAMLSMVDQIGRQDLAPRPVGDPHAELESILSERSFMLRISRLHELVARVAADDPLAAADLLDDMPGSLVQHVMDPLVVAWSRTNPEEAARWLADKDDQFSENGLNALAWQWGQSDPEAASAFADTLTGRKRTTFLASLADSAVQRMSTDEMLAWVSRYENDPARAGMVMSVSQHLVREDLLAAMGLIETLPDRERLSSYRAVVSTLALDDPEAAIDLLDEIGDGSVRDDVLPMISSVWGHTDAQAALDWAMDLARGASRDRAIASIASSLVVFDRDRAVEAIDEIDDPEIRKGPVWQLLVAVDSDDEAIRLGRDYDFDRDAVLELREGRSGMHGAGVLGIGPRSYRPVSVTVAGEYKDADRE